jgi:hypothetical protein
VKIKDDNCIVEVSWGYFTMEITILRIFLAGKKLHGDKVAGKGAYSQTYLTYYKKRNFIVKSVDLNKSSQNIALSSFSFDPKIPQMI